MLLLQSLASMLNECVTMRNDAGALYKAGQVSQTYSCNPYG